MKNIISYSLWGTDLKYTIGAIRNAESAHVFYPGWTTRFYCASTVPQNIIEELKRYHAEIIKIHESGNNTGMFWRFFALDDITANRILIRDTDSRLTQRESLAVEEWIQSNLPAHIMRDHPWHNMPILGGMWGIKSGYIHNIAQLIKCFSPKDKHNQDQIFLEKYIYPRFIKIGVYISDPFKHFEKFAHPFPSPRKNYEFIGEIFDENDQRGNEWTILRDIEKKPYIAFKLWICRLFRKIRFQYRFIKL